MNEATQFTTWAMDTIDPLDQTEEAWASDGILWNDDIEPPAELTIILILANL